MIYKNEILSKYNWFNLGGPAKILFKPNSIHDLENFLKKNNKENKIYVLGAGSNILFRDSGFDGAIIISSALKSAFFASWVILADLIPVYFSFIIFGEHRFLTKYS